MRWIRALERLARQTFLSRRLLFLAALTLVVAAFTTVEAELQSVGQGPARRYALIGVAAAAATLFLLSQFVLPKWLERDAMTSGTRPRTLPARAAPLVGRHDDIEALLERHRTDSLDSHRQRPLMMFIHGMPGVGKSAFALEMAHRLAAEYPDGQIYAKMNTVGNKPRDPADLLGIFLVQLGRADALEKAKEERVGLFRTQTARRRILFVLDGARDEAQVKDLLPSGSRCLVIVSSRRDIGRNLGAASYWLRPPDPVDAARIVRLHLPHQDSPPADITARVVEICGGLPMAIVTACERAGEASDGLAQVVAQLETRGNRMRLLGRQAQKVGSAITRDIVARIQAEYDLLPSGQRRAFAMLSLVRTATFVPWVLQPLLETNAAEAFSLMAKLSSAQLVVPVRADRTEFTRYTFNELLRVFAEERLRSDFDEEERTQAASRLHQATLACCSRVLEVLDGLPSSQATQAVPRSWLPDIQGWERAVASEDRFWVKAEFAGLIDAIFDAAARSDPNLSWRIARQLVGCGTAGNGPEYVAKAFETSLQRARRRGVGAVDSVKLAYGTHMVEAGMYDTGLRLLHQVVSRNGRADRLLAFRAHAYAGEVLQRIGVFKRAESELESAREIASAVMGPPEQIEMDVLLAANRAVTTPGNWHDDIGATTAYTQSHESSPNVYVKVALADCAARRSQWPDALRRLTEATAAATPDESMMAFLGYKMASVLIRKAEADGSCGASDCLGAVARAGCVVAAYRRMSNTDGELRARALLAEAHLLVGQVEECAQQIRKTWSLGRGLGPDFHGEYGRALRAALLRLEGEVMLARGDYSLALTPLDRALELYDQCGMFWDRARTQVSLGRAFGMLRERSRALCLLHAALWRFETCGDGHAAWRAAAEVRALAA